MGAPLTVGCIGAGYFSQFHYDAWSRISGARPVAAVDQDIAKARETGLAAYSDAQAMLDAQRPDIVDIITPPPTHLGLIKAALAIRPKAIVCQKPFCTGLKEAELAVCLANEAGVPLIVHENFRFQPWYRYIKAEIEGGRLGDVQQVTFRLRPGDGQGPEAYLDRQPYFQTMERFLVHETAVHWIDTFRYLLGQPDAVFADLRRMNPAIRGEDAGHILFAYPNGARAQFDGNRLLDHAAQNTRCTMGEALVEGTRGTLALAGDGSVRLREFGDLAEKIVLPPNEASGFGGDCVYHLQSHVVAALAGEAPFENTAGDYLDVIRQVDAVYRSAEKGAWVSLSEG